MRVEKVLAPNPSPWTGPGTNTWVIGDDTEVAVLDPGPVMDVHADAIADVVDDRDVVAVIVTHTHIDHAPLANPLAHQWDTVALGYGSSDEFRPDTRLVEGSTVEVAGASLEVVHTPGHADDHLCFVLDRWMFTGDHIMGGSTVMVQDLTAYLASLRKVRDRALDRLFPGHGPEIDDPAGVIDYYISHRLEREEQVIAALRAGAGSVGAIVEDVYADVDPELHPIAAHSVAAHVGKLVDDGVVDFDRTTDLWGSLVRLIH
ncbi:MAG: MBL fold metallo-hydrolase [Acidimicrobiia bacterium]|nr:MBL fold metallo-hydrolase [Acidimicrobiia bacterium]